MMLFRVAVAGQSQTSCGGYTEGHARGDPEFCYRPLYHYALVKGSLAGQNAPSEALVAVEALYMAAVHTRLSRYSATIPSMGALRASA